MLMCSLVCAVILGCIIENQYRSSSSMKRMKHIFSHVYGFDCVQHVLVSSMIGDIYMKVFLAIVNLWVFMRKLRNKG
ncbi:hypothetical protein QL285_010898 [Trifolium repens]|nr:hypothetical protein QL285_010898 [Trifolium repens]